MDETRKGSFAHDLGLGSVPRHPRPSEAVGGRERRPKERGGEERRRRRRRRKGVVSFGSGFPSPRPLSVRFLSFSCVCYDTERATTVRVYAFAPPFAGARQDSAFFSHVYPGTHLETVGPSRNSPVIGRQTCRLLRPIPGVVSWSSVPNTAPRAPLLHPPQGSDNFHSRRSWSPRWNGQGPLIGAYRWTATMLPEVSNWAAMGLKFFEPLRSVPLGQRFGGYRCGFSPGADPTRNDPIKDRPRESGDQRGVSVTES
ncbi:hypothetical protein MUK42_24928 [Musa troglodytarum]|uniref:Uncharacterized protein n=1 Tax=Musa troglodytarum TaxID=320322 RepID=A0A9E7E9T3_9LILI|nr:hypothetical protein MUK42_24928 [Musa troglodytarum]